MAPKQDNQERSNNKVPKGLMQEALELRDSGEYDQAATLLASVVAEYPKDLDLRIVYAGILFHLQRYLECLEHFRAILKIRPTVEPASVGAFICLWKTGRTEEAMEEMRAFFTAQAITKPLKPSSQVWMLDF